MADRFSGFYEHALDPKGRITIPSKFREQLGNSIAMLRGKGPCVRVCSLHEWNRMMEKYDAVDEDENPTLYDKMRRQMSTSVDDNLPDKQGRLLIPPALREYAHLDKDVIVTGVGRNVEIWDRERFHAFIQEGVKEA